jgi:membrane-associated phospholipid phosphatase
MEFLTSAEAAKRVRIVLRGSVLLWFGALMAWRMRADGALLRRFDASPFFGSLRPVFEWYADWGLFIFYAFFIALLVYGMRHTRPLFKLAGLAYVYAQVFGTLLLVRLIKIGCGRPRPHVASSHDALCQAPSLAHAFNSFPSSHAVNAAVGAMFVLLLLRSRVAALLALTAALFMALARIAIGEHYLSDVLAGMALGVTIAAFVIRVFLLPRWRSIETASAQ